MTRTIIGKDSRLLPYQRVGELTISYLLIEVGEQEVAHVHKNIKESEEDDSQPSLQQLNACQLGSNQGSFSNACSPAAFLP